MFLSEYFASVVLISSLVAFFELFSYSGGEEKGERLAVCVIMIYLIISPLLPMVEGLRDFDISEITGTDGELSGGAYLDASEEAFKKGIEKLLYEKWGLPKSEAVVTVVGFDFNKMKAERIIITLLSGAASVDFREIEACVSEAGLGECEVKYAI